MTTSVRVTSHAVTPAAAAVLAAAVALCAIASALVGYAVVGAPWVESPLALQAGLETSPEGAVTRVLPGGPAWIAGLRPGAIVESTYSAEVDRPGAVSICSATECLAYNDLQVRSALAGRWIFQLLAAVLAAIGLMTWRHRPRLGGLLGLAAIAATAPTFALMGQVPLLPTLYVGSLIAPATWLRLTGPNRYWTVAALGSLALAAVWTIVWLAQPEAYDAVESARVAAVVVTIAAGVAVASGWTNIVDGGTSRDRVTDAVVILGVAGSAFAAWRFGVIPDWLSAAGAGFAIVAYVVSRRRLRGLLARVTFAELGQRATLQVLEAERSRVARDLHDVPLQELTAVIHRLDGRRESPLETERLREVARHLRDMSISLRPPVLDDVGLGAALVELAGRQELNGAAPIQTSLDDETGIDAGSRPPAEVELALFRIVQEAIINAQRHARATAISVEGAIGKEHIQVTVSDDGLGIDTERASKALRAGRLGLASMRDRAAAIGATLTIARAPGGSGTAVSVDWSDR